VRPVDSGLRPRRGRSRTCRTARTVATPVCACRAACLLASVLQVRPTGSFCGADRQPRTVPGRRRQNRVRHTWRHMLHACPRDTVLRDGVHIHPITGGRLVGNASDGVGRKTQSRDRRDRRDHDRRDHDRRDHDRRDHDRRDESSMGSRSCMGRRLLCSLADRASHAPTQPQVCRMQNLVSTWGYIYYPLR